jgi:fermentation-respiration switch protein FrsA (DUF1100 family)
VPRRWWKRIGSALLILAGALLVITLLARCMLFPRALVRADPRAGEGVLGLERIWIDSPQGKVEGWFLLGAGASRSAPGPLVIFAHGNAELIDLWLEGLEPYRRLGVSVFLPEYRGYGRSAGSPSQAAITEDFLRFHDRVVARPEIDRTRVVLHGRSLGGGAVCALALARPPRALILQSAFTSVPAMARRYLVPSFLIRDRFDNLEAVRRLQPRLLVIHGEHDELIPFSHGQALQAATRGGRLLPLPCGHNDCPGAHEGVFWRELERFLREAGILRR